MTAKDATVLKGYFNTGDTPTEAQFANLIDSFLPGDSDATDLQGALDGLSNSGVLQLPAGTFALGATGLTMDGTIDIQGAGMNATTITYTGTGAAIQVNSGAAVTTNRWSISDLTIDCLDTGAYGIILGQGSTSPKAAHQGALHRVRCTGATTAGLLCAESQNNRFFDCHFDSNTGDGVQMIPAEADIGVNTMTKFFGCHFWTNEGKGFYSEGGAKISFYGCIFELNYEEGVYLAKQTNSEVTTDFRFDTCYWEQNNYESDPGQYRSGTGWAQFRIEEESAVTGQWKNISLMRPWFNAHGTDNYHMYADKCQLLVEYPICGGTTTLGTDSGSSSAWLRFIDDASPSWTLGGNNTNGIWDERSYNYLHRVYENDGSAAWTATIETAVS